MWFDSDNYLHPFLFSAVWAPADTDPTSSPILPLELLCELIESFVNSPPLDRRVADPLGFQSSYYTIKYSSKVLLNTPQRHS
ncbi:hypothetical protein CAAN3_04S02322 [[Candida] anglica]